MAVMDPFHLRLMQFIDLIRSSKKELSHYEIDYKAPVGFNQGGAWISSLLGGADNHDVDYRSWGILKYVLSCTGLLASYILWQALTFNFFLSAVLFFYIIEAHFFFLFPLLADNKAAILATCFRATHQVGLFKIVVNVIPLAAYMVVGLLNIKKPFYNWYVGCMSVVIWYKNEIRDRF